MKQQDDLLLYYPFKNLREWSSSFLMSYPVGLVSHDLAGLAVIFSSRRNLHIEPRGGEVVGVLVCVAIGV